MLGIFRDTEPTGRKKTGEEREEREKTAIMGAEIPIECKLETQESQLCDLA